MLSLSINNHEVDLPQDTTIEIIKENPLFASNGGYTYDIDLPLRNPRNASLYTKLSRTNATGRISNRRAVLRDGLRNVIVGTEIVLSKDADVAKIQVVSDNSELNYLAGDNRKIRDLSLGSAVDVDRETASANVRKVYPEVDFTYPMVYFYKSPDNPKGSTLVNRYGDFDSTKPFEYSEDLLELRPMPFVLAIVDKVINAIGYTMTYNFASLVPKWRRLAMINRYATLEYAKMLPDWTVSEFLSEIEHFFNGVFIVDSSNAEVQFISVNSYASQSEFQYVHAKDVLDDFTVACQSDSDSEFHLCQRYVEYDLPKDCRFYKMADLDKELYDNCIVKPIGPVQVDLSSWDSFMLYLDAAKGMYFKLFKIPGTDAAYDYYEVNQFKGRKPLDGDSSIKLRIIPSSHTVAVENVAPESEMEGGVFPVLTSIALTSAEDSDSGFWDYVSEGVPQQDELSSFMSVFFYAGLGYLRKAQSETELLTDWHVPMVFTSYWHVAWSDGTFTHFFNPGHSAFDRYSTLELVGSRGRIDNEFENGLYIDATKKYTFRFSSSADLDPMRIFVIKNRKYACRELKYVYDKLHFTGVVEGIFYPIKTVDFTSQVRVRGDELIVPEGFVRNDELVLRGIVDGDEISIEGVFDF